MASKFHVLAHAGFSSRSVGNDVRRFLDLFDRIARADSDSGCQDYLNVRDVITEVHDLVGP